MANRREVLTAMAALGFGGEAEAQETIYRPERHIETDRAYIQTFLREFPFAMVVTTHGGLHITNVPTVWSKLGDEWGNLWWHIAKNNAQNAPLTEGVEATVVFHGPHSYISPNWYGAKSGVPTWNFAVVHCAGKPVRVTDDAKFAEGLARLVAANEKEYGGGEAWDFAKLPESYLKGMRQGIVGYEMKIERVEAKFKMGQEWSAAQKEKVAAALKAGKGLEKSFAALSEEYWKFKA